MSDVKSSDLHAAGPILLPCRSVFPPYMRKIILAIIRMYLSPTMLNFSSSTLPSFHSAFWNAVALFSFDVCKCVNLFLKLCNSDWDLNPHGGFPGGTVVKNLLADAGDIDLIPGQEDPLEKEMETHSSNLAWKIPWTEEPGQLQSMGSQCVRHN